jgi:hypothetical protein
MLHMQTAPPPTASMPNSVVKAIATMQGRISRAANRPKSSDTPSTMSRHDRAWLQVAHLLMVRDRGLSLSVALRQADAFADAVNRRPNVPLRLAVRA